MRLKAFAIAASTVLLTLFTVGCNNSKGTTVGTDVPSVQEQTAPAADTSLPDNAFRITLYPDKAPITCENFESLVSDGFYDGLTFHRVVDNFMAQGGDPQGTGMGGSKKQIKGEFSSNGVKNDLSHTRGVVSMARSSMPNSASSQFFICYSDKDTFLDGNYAAFGKVTEGMEVVDSFLKVKRVQGSDDEISSPTTKIIIDHAKMISKDADGNPRAEFVMKDFLPKSAETTAAVSTTSAADTTAAESSAAETTDSAASSAAETTDSAASSAAETTDSAASSAAKTAASSSTSAAA